MKIAFVYDVPYPWHVGGIESMNFNEAEELAKRHEVHYFTTKWPGMKSNEFIKSGIRYHAYGETDQKKIYKNGRRSTGEAMAFKLTLRRMFDYRFDVIITNQFPILHLPMVKLFCAVTGAKLIMEVAEAWDEKYWKSYIGGLPGVIAYNYQLLLTGGADAYVTISSKTTSDLMKLGIRNEKIREFSPAIDDLLINSIRRKKGHRTKTVIFSGRLIKEKQVDKWIELVAKAQQKDGSLRGLIIGKGPERAALEEKIKKSGMSGKIVIRDFYDDNSEFYAAVRDSSVMLNLSKREGLGIIAIEGIALGTPVVLPRATPLPKEVKEMCVVADEDKIPSIIAKIADSKDRSRYIRNEENLKMFYKSRVNNFYDRLFAEIGAKPKRT
jgi:glycosyltransferase involved in cell wall biosynthesis